MGPWESAPAKELVGAWSARAGEEPPDRVFRCRRVAGIPRLVCRPMSSYAFDEGSSAVR